MALDDQVKMEVEPAAANAKAGAKRRNLIAEDFMIE
jgi:hypothetical protein